MSSNSSDAGGYVPITCTITSAPTTSTASISSIALPCSSTSSSFLASLGSKPDALPRPGTPKQMATPTSLSEWQLLAVLHRANLVQYYEIFISQGGDDINQIMQCDEHEFLEIMSLVGMLTKPLHVRRLQRALNEFSKDQSAFNLTALQQIGPPPVSPYTLNGADPMSLLLPGISMLNSLSSSSEGVASDATSPSHNAVGSSSSHGGNNSVALAFELAPPVLEPMAPHRRVVSSGREDVVVGSPSVVASGLVGGASSSAGSANVGHPRATANIVSGNHIGQYFGTATPSASGSLLRPQPDPQQQQSVPVSSRRPTSASNQEKERPASPFLVLPNNDFVSLGDFDPNNLSQTESPVLSAAQIARLAECSLTASRRLPDLQPRYVQNKKRISKEVLDLLSSSPTSMPNRLEQFRKFSAIYGRFDTRRNPHKVLSLHETAVNEAAAQICLQVPALLTRRDELFPLARQIVKDAGYQYAKSRKRPCEPADLHSPMSSPSNSPPPSGAADDGFETDSSQPTPSEPRSREQVDHSR
ncbi:unnamed protein product [Caenorhabditis auriculariae]|uniref:NAB co-repressor domain-containing protein n=1 Tax=Caenorhabditis auriculariae TaxID=2777116 RepID=A0A8S1HWR2_9PELO|nr:unnamed protein product [Caenorhabditis auriculariae]